MKNLMRILRIKPTDIKAVEHIEVYPERDMPEVTPLFQYGLQGKGVERMQRFWSKQLKVCL